MAEILIPMKNWELNHSYPLYVVKRAVYHHSTWFRWIRFRWIRGIWRLGRFWGFWRFWWFWIRPWMHSHKRHLHWGNGESFLWYHRWKVETITLFDVSYSDMRVTKGHLCRKMPNKAKRHQVLLRPLRGDGMHKSGRQLRFGIGNKHSRSWTLN